MLASKHSLSSGTFFFLDNSVDNNVDNSEGNSVDNGVDNGVDNSVDNGVDNSVDNSVDNGVDNSVDNSVDSGVDNSLEQGCPTRGPIGMLVRPFLLLSSLTPFFKGGEIFLGRENFSMEVNFVEMSEKFREIGFWQVSRGKYEVLKKKSSKKFKENEVK